MTLLPHPPYSPDLAHCDFFLFTKLKKEAEEVTISGGEGNSELRAAFDMMGQNPEMLPKVAEAVESLPRLRSGLL